MHQIGKNNHTATEVEETLNNEQKEKSRVDVLALAPSGCKQIFHYLYQSIRFRVCGLPSIF